MSNNLQTYQRHFLSVEIQCAESNVPEAFLELFENFEEEDCYMFSDNRHRMVVSSECPVQIQQLKTKVEAYLKEHQS